MSGAGRARIGAILLAAGLSRRMGTQKMLLPFAGRTVVEHLARQLLESGVDEVLVVVGHEGNGVAAALAGDPVRIVRNAEYQAGMLSSVRSGLRALALGSTAALVALGDQPALTSGLVDHMIQSFRPDSHGILVPCHQGRRGHPLLIASRWHAEILACYDDVGLRGLALAHPEEVLELEVPTPAVLSDMDYPEDYRRELARLESNGGEA